MSHVCGWHAERSLPQPCWLATFPFLLALFALLPSFLRFNSIIPGERFSLHPLSVFLLWRRASVATGYVLAFILFPVHMRMAAAILFCVFWGNSYTVTDVILLRRIRYLLQCLPQRHWSGLGDMDFLGRRFPFYVFLAPHHSLCHRLWPLCCLM